MRNEIEVTKLGNSVTQQDSLNKKPLSLYFSKTCQSAVVLDPGGFRRMLPLEVCAGTFFADPQAVGYAIDVVEPGGYQVNLQDCHIIKALLTQ